MRKSIEKVLESIKHKEVTTVSDVLHNVFSNESIEQNHDGNLLPLVEYCYKNHCFCNRAITGEEEELPHLVSKFDSVLQILERKGIDTKFGRVLWKELATEPRFFIPVNVWRYIRDHWDQIYQCDETYALMDDLVLIEQGTWASGKGSFASLLFSLQEC